MIRSLAMFTILHAVSGAAHAQQGYCVPKATTTVAPTCKEQVFATSAASCKAAPTAAAPTATATAAAPTAAAPTAAATVAATAAAPTVPATSAPLTCDAGKGDSGDKTTCCTCNMGWYRASGAADLACQSCPSGKTTKSTGSSKESDCVCNKGQYSDGTSCKSCDAGKYGDTLGATSCKACPSGKPISSQGSSDVNQCRACQLSEWYDSAAKACKACPTGKLAKQGSTSEASCKACDGATPRQTISCTKVTVDGNDNPDCDLASCTAKCAAGFYKLTQNGQDICVGCSSGQYSLKEDATECTSAYCLAGTWSDNGNAYKDPSAKGAISESAARSALCKKCPAGKYTAAATTGQASCKTCANNEWSAEGSEKCTACATGTTFTQFETKTAPCPSPSSLTSGAVTLGAGISSTVIFVATLGQLLL